MNPEEYAQLFKLGQTHWWFVGTRDILCASLRGYASANTRILDVGCGSGLMMSRMSNTGSVFGVDSSEAALRHCKNIGLSGICRGDAETLPFKAETFDLIVAADLLEHCEDDQGVLAEFNRITASGGTLLISVPAYRGLWSAHDIALHHVRRYSKQELMRKVETAGFGINRTSFFNTLLFAPVAVERLLFERPGRVRPKEGIKYYENLRLLNKILLTALRLEKWFLNFGTLPFGLSILVIASKR
jgi:SAM-dependent methyltransferase